MSSVRVVCTKSAGEGRICIVFVSVVGIDVCFVSRCCGGDDGGCGGGDDGGHCLGTLWVDSWFVIVATALASEITINI